MIKLFASLVLSVSFLLATINLNTANKDELMSIKGIGNKKAEQILMYRKTNSLNNAMDLKNIKGFGKKIISNVKNDVKKKSKSKKKKKKKNKMKKESK